MTLDIEARGLTLRYGDFTALRDLTFRLEGGGIYGLLGRNGSGKTSLLSVIAGFRPSSGGDALVDGEPVFENRRVTRQICLIREGGDVMEHAWPHDGVEQALAFAARFRPHWDAGYARALVERFRLPLRKRATHLSRGQRSALAVTLGLASRAPVTIFDEVYLGMDAPSRYAFYEELLADYMEHPRTIVLSTHLIEEVSSLFEQVVIIDEGRLVLHDDAEALRARGASVTGPAEAVDRFVEGHTVLGERQLGRTRSVVVYGAIEPADRTRAANLGLELEPVPLQDLFVHLTEPERRLP